MKFTADKDALLTLFSKAAGTVSNKDIQPILKNFLIKAEEGSLACLSTDMSLGALAEFELPTIEEEGTVCAPATKLLNMIKTSPPGMVSLVLDGKLLTVKAGYKKEGDNEKFKSKWELHCEDGGLYPEFPTFKSADAVECAREDFVVGLNRVSFAAADSEIKINLMAVYVNNGYMYAADGHRACRLKFESEIQDLMIPYPAVTMLVKLLRDSQVKEIKIHKTKFHLLFKVGANVYHSRLLDKKFPDIEKRVFADTEGYTDKLSIKRAELKAALKRAQITASNETKQLSLFWEGGVFILRTQNTIEDKFEEMFGDASWSGDDFERTINWEYLEDVVNALKEESVDIYFGEDKGNRKSKFRIQEGDFVAIVMPLRIKVDAQGRQERVHDRVKAHVEAQEATANMSA